MEAVFIKAGFALTISFLVTFYLVPLCIKIAKSLQFIDTPDGKIKQHKQATPYMGGGCGICWFFDGFLSNLSF